MKLFVLLMAVTGAFVAFLALASPALGSSGLKTITTDTTLTEDHNGNIVVAADNVTLDCAGHNVTGNGSHGDGSGTGILVAQRMNVTVKACRVTGFSSGISVSYSGSTLVKDNTLVGNYEGIYVEGGAGNRFVGNRIVMQGGYGGMDVFWSTDPAIVGNTLTGQESEYGTPFGFRLVGSTGGLMMANGARNLPGAAFVATNGSSDSTFVANVSQAGVTGVYVVDSSGIRVLSNSLQGSIDVSGSPSTTILWNSVDGSSISVSDSDSSKIVLNLVTKSYSDAIHVEGGADYLIQNNTERAGQSSGILLSRVDRVRVVGNSCSQNTSNGFAFDETSTLWASGNTAYQNGYDGIFVSASVKGADLVGNSSSANGASGFNIAASASSFTGNTALANRKYGFFVGRGALGNTLRRNAGFGNAAYDAADFNSPGANSWLSNRFGTAFGI